LNAAVLLLRSNEFWIEGGRFLKLQRSLFVFSHLT
jgi:hypothetical protein